MESKSKTTSYHHSTQTVFFLSISSMRIVFTDASERFTSGTKRYAYVTPLLNMTSRNGLYDLVVQSELYNECTTDNWSIDRRATSKISWTDSPRVFIAIALSLSLFVEL